MNNYDYKQGALKGVKFVLTALVALAVASGFSEVTLWELLEKYLKPLLGTLSVGGLLAITQNYVKVKFGGVRGLLGLGK
mgnify:CR=1 FL=1